jgi:hypothetical protein
MMTLIFAAAAAAAQPAPAHPSVPGNAHSQMAMPQSGEGGEHKAKDCCKDCCKHMANNEGHGSGHSEDGSE